jgi:two-component system OmpR family sensor kinase
MIVVHSLRRRLLWFLLAAITIAAAAQASIAYRSALRDADEIFDYNMRQMALTLRSGVPMANDGHGVAGPLDEENELMLQVWTSDGVQVFRSVTRAQLPQHAVLGFSDVKANNTVYRVFSEQTPTMIVQVAQDRAIRRNMASNLALRTVGPIVLMVPVLMLVVWWVVSGSLAPVSRVRGQVASRQADDLSPVSEQGLPEEVLPLVQELNALFGRVRTAFEAQQSFVANAAHELRTPLAALKLQAASLERADSPEARALAVTRLSAGIERASRMVEQLLVLARQEAAAAHASAPAVQQLALDELLRRTLAEMAATAQARQIDLGVHQADPARIDGQPEALMILLRNLIDNAIKYTPAGGRVDASVTQESDAVVLCVEDSGPGIPAEEREKVFSRFYRIPGSEASGSGLGLAIIKSICERHRATLQLETSARLGGLSICVRFPITVQA